MQQSRPCFALDCLHCCRLGGAGSDPVCEYGGVFVVRQFAAPVAVPATVKFLPNCRHPNPRAERPLCVLAIGAHFPPLLTCLHPSLSFGSCCSPCESDNGAARPGRGAGGHALLGVQDQGDDRQLDQSRQGMRGLEQGCSLLLSWLQVVCTLGPASRAVEVIEELLRAGMNVARFNFSHGSHEYHKVRRRWE